MPIVLFPPPSFFLVLVHMGDFWGRFLVLSRETPCGEAIYGPSFTTTSSALASEAAAAAAENNEAAREMIETYPKLWKTTLRGFNHSQN